MRSQFPRAFRKNFVTQGRIVLDTVKYPVIVKNISTTGVLVIMVNPGDADKLVSLSDEPVVVALDLPEIALDCAAEVVRIVKNAGESRVALSFIDQTAETENNIARRRSLRNNVFGTGYLLINGQYLEFNALNTSGTGAKIFLPQKISLETNTEVVFKFEKMDLAGKARIRWIDNSVGGGTMIGLNFVERFQSTIS